MKQKLTMGMVGGGEGSFMGEVHRMAARLDGSFDCVAGALSSSVEKARRSGQALGLAPDRIYDSFKDLIERESQRPDRVDIVSVVTPNHRHFAPIKLALQFGFDVVVDKPMCVSINEARELGELVLSTGKFLAVT